MKYYEKDSYRYFIHVHAYANFTRLRRGQLSRNRLASLDAPEKY